MQRDLADIGEQCLVGRVQRPLVEPRQGVQADTDQHVDMQGTVAFFDRHGDRAAAPAVELTRRVQQTLRRQGVDVALAGGQVLDPLRLVALLQATLQRVERGLQTVAVDAILRPKAVHLGTRLAEKLRQDRVAQVAWRWRRQPILGGSGLPLKL